MSEPHDHAATACSSHDHSHDAAAPFNSAEIAHFQSEDLAAGKAVVCLMVGIFSVGVVLYTIVAVACGT